MRTQKKAYLNNLIPYRNKRNFMKIKNTIFFTFVLMLSITSCKKDDDTSTFVERDRTEQQVIDKDSLLGYLETHYYNSSAFETPSDYSIDDIIITELPQDESGNYLGLPDPENNTLLIDAVETHMSNYFDVDYEYYILRLNQGGGESPNFTDNVLINYSGFTQDNNVFDSTVNPDTPFDMINLIRGWRDVIPQFNTASTFLINPDNTISYSNYGFGVMFLPSGLAYFSSPPFGINSYSNLIFKFELYQSEVNDHDNDGVPSYLEDLDNSLSVFDDDTDNDDSPNFLDIDDDGDGVLSIHEDIDGDGDPSNDIGANGIPRYLDPDETDSNQD